MVMHRRDTASKFLPTLFDYEEILPLMSKWEPEERNKDKGIVGTSATSKGVGEEEEEA